MQGVLTLPRRNELGDDEQARRLRGWKIDNLEVTSKKKTAAMKNPEAYGVAIGPGRF